MRPTVLLVLLGALLLTSCELRLATDIVIERDGAGTFELSVALDPELREILLDAGFEPLGGVDELRTAAPDWEVQADDTEDGGLAITLATRFDGPEDFAALTDGLHEVLDDQDGRLWDRLRIERDDGHVKLSGSAGLLVPRSPGATGVEFDEEDLAELVRERGEEFVRYELRLSVPGDIVAHDADEASGSTLVWRLPVGESRPVSAEAELASQSTPLLLAAVALFVASGTAVSIVAVRARRAAARRRAARGRMT